MAINLDGDGLTTTGLINTRTAQASTSGTSIDFTGIPAGVKRITVMLNGVSTNGASVPIIQLGSGSVTTSGYLGASQNNGTPSSFTTGIPIVQGVNAASTFRGIATICLLGSNAWVASVNMAFSDAAVVSSGSSGVTLAGTLDRVRITTVNGTDTFDAGSINILYE